MKTIAVLSSIFIVIVSQSVAQPPFAQKGSGLFSTGATPSTVLAMAAASIAPGEWAEVTSTDLVATMGTPALTSAVNVWGETLAWDSTGGVGYWVGGDHNDESYFNTYTEATSDWAMLDRPAWMLIPTIHQWEHLSIDPAARQLYFWEGISTNFWRYDIATTTWSAIASPVSLAVNWRTIGAITWVEDWNALLTFIDDRLFRFDKSTDSWSVIDDIPVRHAYETFAEYNPVVNKAIFGGGFDESVGPTADRLELWSIDNAEIITQMNDVAFSLRVRGICPVVTYDPVGGDFLVLRPEQDEFYSYNVLTDTWTLLETSATLPTDFKYVSAAPIPELGVVLFVNMQSKVAGNLWVYKHANL